MISYVKKLYANIATVLVFALLRTTEAFCAETTHAVSPCGGSTSTYDSGLITMIFPLAISILILILIIRYGKPHYTGQTTVSTTVIESAIRVAIKKGEN